MTWFRINIMNDFLYFKMEIFIPESHLEARQETLRSEDVGHIKITGE